MNYHALRLVYNDNILVLVNDINWDILGNCLADGSLGEKYLNNVSCLQLTAFGHIFTVNGYSVFGKKPLCRAAAQRCFVCNKAVKTGSCLFCRNCQLMIGPLCVNHLLLFPLLFSFSYFP